MSIKFTANEIRYIALFENMTGDVYKRQHVLLIQLIMTKDHQVRTLL